MESGVTEKRRRRGQVSRRTRGIRILSILCIFILIQPLMAGNTSFPEGAISSPAEEKTVVAYQKEGIALMGQKNLTGLGSVTEAGLARFPDDPELHCLKGYLLRKTGHFAEAADNVSIAIPKDPKPIRYANRGYAYLAMGRYPYALNDTDSALALDPAYPVAYAVRALAFNGMEINGDAEDAALTAIRLDPTSALYWHIYGKILESKGDISRAGAAYKISLAIDPNYDLPWPGFSSATTDLERVSLQGIPVSLNTKVVSCFG